MIVIKTANGDRFINEAEVKNVQHNKSACIVTIKFKDGTFDVAYGVESMYYTNKADTEIRDNGLILGSTTTDKEYWKEMAQSAEQFIQDLQHWRNELENFILGYLGQPDEPYAVRFVKEMEEKRHKVEDLKSDLDQLKRWHESEAQELERLEKSYAWALAEYAGIIFKEGIDFENAQGPDAGQLAEQRSGD